MEKKMYSREASQRSDSGDKKSVRNEDEVAERSNFELDPFMCMNFFGADIKKNTGAVVVAPRYHGALWNDVIGWG
jgi:hypothetical protein